MTQTLAEKTCAPCRGGILPLTAGAALSGPRPIGSCVTRAAGSSGRSVLLKANVHLALPCEPVDQPRARVNRQPGASGGRPTSARRRPRAALGGPRCYRPARSGAVLEARPRDLPPALRGHRANDRLHRLRAHERCHLGSAWMSDAALAVGVSTTGVGASRLPNSHADRNESARKLPGQVFK